MYIYVYICIYVYIYINVCIYNAMKISHYGDFTLRTFNSLRAYPGTRKTKHNLKIFEGIYIYIYISVFIHIYIYICIYYKFEGV